MHELLHLPSAPDLLNVLEHVDDVPRAARALLDLAGQSQRGHGHLVELYPDHRLGVEETVEEHARRSHGHLKWYRKCLRLDTVKYGMCRVASIACIQDVPKRMDLSRPFPIFRSRSVSSGCFLTPQPPYFMKVICLLV